MKVFDKYADFYDSYYRDKDYDNEVNFVFELEKQSVYGFFKATQH